MAEEGERDQMLIDFQECTQIEDLETCIDILEQNNWNLMAAIQSVTPQAANSDLSVDGSGLHPVHLPSASATIHTDCGVSPDPPPSEYFNDVYSSPYNPGSAAGPFWAHASTSSFTVPARRMLNFIIEYRGRNITAHILDNEKVLKLKEFLSTELNIPVEEMDLKGWPTRKVDDKSLLCDLHLPKDNVLFLLTPGLKPGSSTSSESSIAENLSKEYTLAISHLDAHNSTKEYNIQFSGSKTVGEVKQSTYHLTNIPVRHQFWTGWPKQCQSDDALTLGACGLDFPVHRLTVSSNSEESSNTGSQDNQHIVDISDEEDCANDYPMEEDILFESETRNKQTPLIPEEVSDETGALEHFTKEFRNRYGETHPVFYVGSLDEAIKEALLGKAKDRKLLAVYLHHDSSVLSNVFCSQTLCMDSIVNYLCNNFITWGWDMTLETNCNRFITMATRHFGSVVAGQCRFHKPDQLPVLLIISRSRSTNEVIDMIPGSVTLDELMTRLMQDHENFLLQMQSEIKEEEEREARENIIQEQERAYAVSLAADRKKAEAQRLEEEKLKELQRLEELKKQEEEAEKRKEEERKQMIQDEAANQIPDEPPANCSEPVSKLRIKTPNGEMIQRCFYAREKLKSLIFYVTSLGFHKEEFKILTTFPRRDVLTLDENKSLKELNIYPQETLILEERH